MFRILAVIVALLVLAPAWAKKVEKPERRDISAEDRYDLCVRQMKRGSYTKALEHCQKVRNYYRDDPVSLLAELTIADIYFKRGDFEQSRMAYEDFTRLHPRSKHLDYVVWRTGQAIYRRSSKWAGRDQAPTRQAVNTWTGFDSRFPESEWKDDVSKLMGRARDRLANKELYIARFYARRDKWVAVAKRAEGMARRYPESKFAPEALQLAGEAYWRIGAQSDAQRVRERLATDHPGVRELSALERFLASPAGTLEPEPIFVRPYRYPGMGQQGPGGP